MNQRRVLATGTNGFIGNAVAKAFNRAGWKTYALIRNAKDASDLAVNEIHPVIGAPKDYMSLQDDDSRPCVFDVVVSNTEDWSNYEGHFQDVKSMLIQIGMCSQKEGIRPLVLLSSGCKDYGMTRNHGDPDLAPHTESSPLNAFSLLLPRTRNTAGLMESAPDLPFDVTVLRPTTVYGYGSSYYGPLFALAESSKDSGVLRVGANPNNIMHGTHVDDCAEAYVALAQYPCRDEIKGQAFNISNARYETTDEVCKALAKLYGLSLEYDPPMSMDKVVPGMVEGVVQYSQWVSSEKLRNLTGWDEKRPYFAQGIEEYRLSYEAAMALKHHGTMRIKSIFQNPSVWARGSDSDLGPGSV